MISYLLYALFILSCLALIISVLLQPGKADAGSLFTSSVSSTAFGPRGTQTILAKITIGAAATFMIVALLLTMGVGGDSSLMKNVSGGKPAATPAPAASPAEGSNPPAPQTETAPAQGNATAPAAPAGEAPTAATPAAPEKKQ